MESQLESSLVVDASFSSRRQLVRDLGSSGLFGNIVEAPSVREALVSLQSHSHSACLIGPTLSEDTAVDFVKRGIEVTRTQGCAFVAVLPEGRSAEALVKAGAHTTLVKPYTSDSFTKIVKQAIKAATEASSREIVQPKLLPQSLLELANGFESIANDLARGRFSLRTDGQPSLATRDAIRLAIEGCVTTQDQPIQIGSFDHHFISKIVEWFVDRVNTDQQTANSRLRTKLVSYNPPHAST